MPLLGEELRGILAAVASPFCMALGFTIWGKNWKDSSAFSLNLFKCNFASIIFVVSGFIFGFVLQRDDFSWEHVGWLFVSGILGIIIGDLLWLEALQRLGAFQVLVIDTIKPFFAALMGRLFLKEQKIYPLAYVAMMLTVIGVLLVSVEQNKLASSVGRESSFDSPNEMKNDHQEAMCSVTPSTSLSRMIDLPQHTGDLTRDEKKKDNGEEETIPSVSGDTSKLNLSIAEGDRSDKAVMVEKKITSYRQRGYIVAVSNVLLDTYGSLLTKQHGWNFTTWGINLIRFGSSGMLMAILSVSLSLHYERNKSENESHDHETEVLGQEPGSTTSNKQRERREEWYQLPNKSRQSWAKVCLGVVFVTYLCPALSNYALFQIPLAYALTLTSITPIYALFLEWVFGGTSKRPTMRALLGSSFAVGGVVWLGIINSPSDSV